MQRGKTAGFERIGGGRNHHHADRPGCAVRQVVGGQAARPRHRAAAAQGELLKILSGDRAALRLQLTLRAQLEFIHGFLIASTCGADQIGGARDIGQRGGHGVQAACRQIAANSAAITVAREAHQAPIFRDTPVLHHAAVRLAH